MKEVVASGFWSRKSLTLLILFSCFVQVNVCLGNNDSVLFAEKVNLALRRTAHHLFRQNGDSTSRIPPVEQTDANTFIVRMDHLFEYDKLPDLLSESFAVHGVKRGYDVSVLNCDNGQLELGYSFLDLQGKGDIPCKGRKQKAGCYTLKVSFNREENIASANSDFWFVTLGGILAGLGYVVWKRNRKREVREDEPVELPVESSAHILFGNSNLDMTNLMLVSGTDSYQLTYREAKLLNLFAGNKNQVLERDFIMKSVWEDEGIIVGRSVDVFVSRLRKMLLSDHQVKISAVHGVGYRMEVAS